MLRQYELGSQAIDYIKSQLSVGHTLGRSLLDLPLDSGRVAAFLPTGTEPESLYAFQWGGVATATDGVWENMASFVSTYLRGGVGRYAVFEGFRPADRMLTASGRQYFSFGPDEIYYFASSAGADSPKVEVAADAGRSYPYIGVLTSIPEDSPDIRSGSDICEELLKELAARAQHLLIGAYDDEAPLVWTRS